MRRPFRIAIFTLLGVAGLSLLAATLLVAGGPTVARKLATDYVARLTGREFVIAGQFTPDWGRHLDVEHRLEPGAACSPDELAARSGASVAEVLAELLRLELAGLVERLDDGRYARASGNGPAAPAGWPDRMEA